MHIIGFAGKSGSGKTAAALAAANCLVRMGYSVKLDTFGDPVRKNAINEFGSLDSDDIEQRKWMQEDATDRRASSPHCLVNRLILRNNLDCVSFADGWEPADFLLIHDIRMPDEFTFCSHRGVVVFMMGTHKPLPESLAMHGTENALDGLLHGTAHLIPKQPSLSSLSAVIKTLIESGHHLQNPGNGEPSTSKGA